MSNSVLYRKPEAASTSISQASTLLYRVPAPSATWLVPSSSMMSQNSAPLVTRNRMFTGDMVGEKVWDVV